MPDGKYLGFFIVDKNSPPNLILTKDAVYTYKPAFAIILNGCYEYLGKPKNVNLRKH